MQDVNPTMPADDQAPAPQEPVTTGVPAPEPLGPVAPPSTEAPAVPAAPLEPDATNEPPAPTTPGM